MRSKPCFSSTQVCVCPLLHQVRNSNKRGGRGAKRVKTREIVRNGSAPPSVFTHSVAIVVEDVFGHLTLISKPDILIQLHACSRRIFFFLSPTLHNEAPTQLLHLTNISHIPRKWPTKTRSFKLQYSHTLPASPQNKISSPHAHIVASISDNFPLFFVVVFLGGFTHLAPLPPLLLLLFRTWLVHFFNPYHTRFLHFHKSFFPSRATSFTGRQGGRVVFLPLVVISFLSFLPFQPAGSSSSSSR